MITGTLRCCMRALCLRVERWGTAEFRHRVRAAHRADAISGAPILRRIGVLEPGRGFGVGAVRRLRPAARPPPVSPLLGRRGAAAADGSAARRPAAYSFRVRAYVGMRPDPPTLLLVEDDPIVRTFLADNLTADGYECWSPTRCATACGRWSSPRPTWRSSTSGCRTARASTSSTRVRAADRVSSRLDPSLPLIVLSGRGGELDRLRGFERGVRRLSSPSRSPTASCGGAWRRCSAARASAASLGWLRLGDAGDRPGGPRGPAARRGRAALSQKEFALLLALAAEPTRVFTKEELLRDVWGFRSKGNTRTWTATRAACATSSARAAAGSSSTCGASATGSSTGRVRRGGGMSAAARAAGARRARRRRRRPTSAAALPGARRAGEPRAARAAVRRPPRPARPGGDDAPARVAAIDLELRRAALALDDLAAAPQRAPCARAGGHGRAGRAARRGRRGVAGAGAARAAIALALEPPSARCVVHADRLRLAQACGNLVANAIEHGGGAVRVRTRVADGHARMEVTDAGPGLPAPVAELVGAARGRRAPARARPRASPPGSPSATAGASRPRRRRGARGSCSSCHARTAEPARRRRRRRSSRRASGRR